MSYRVDPELARELEKYGGDTVTKCFNCGNCTAVCALTDDQNVFPRQFIRYMQLGMQDKMVESLEPWMCYYCGECSDTCPREAEPGELMMAARRWLTSKYDWTGLARLMYKSEAWEIGMLALAAIGVLLLFIMPGGFGFRLLAEHPEARSTVMLEHFAPSHIVHWGDIIMAVVLSFFLLTNAARMMYFAMRKSRVPLSAYIIEIKEFVIHLLTQVRWSGCEKNVSVQWVRHIFLVTGYGTMFLLVVVFLPWFQIDNTDFHWTSLFGYYATLVLLAVTIWMLSDRLGKKEQIHKHSHLSDWLFPILLFFTALTGILMHLFRLVDMAMATYVMYTIHLMVAVPMLVIEVPFGKWAHLLYRPLAVFFTAVKRHERTSEVTQPAPATS